MTAALKYHGFARLMLSQTALRLMFSRLTSSVMMAIAIAKEAIVCGRKSRRWIGSGASMATEVIGCSITGSACSIRGSGCNVVFTR